MTEPPTVAVVIPCYRAADSVPGVIAGVGPAVTRIYVVDDACPDRTGERVEADCRDPRVVVLRHDVNLGVGGATRTGYRRALEDGADVVVKLDADGQMDPALIPRLVRPIVEGEADYAKGNRFFGLKALREMPRTRFLGNAALGTLTKISSGYWDIVDPANGFTAVHASVLRELPLDSVSERYFFESDMLHHLYLLRAKVADVPMRARYRGERSSLSIGAVVGEFLWKHLRNACRRIWFVYVVRDFGLASLELLLGLLSLLFGLVFGFIEWRESLVTGEPATAGTVMLAAMPVIVGIQLLLSFLAFDMANVPKVALHPRLKP
ncbi:MAG: glycosyltransferase family 2 protein [Acetobacterales bacterium]